MTDVTREQWLPIVGFEGYYEVSDWGRVRTVPRMMARRNGTTYTVPKRIRSQKVDSTGRWRITLRLRTAGIERTFLVHRLVIEAFVEPQPSNMECCHYDGNPANNHLTNLRWDTRSENRLDSVRHGTHQWANKTHCPAGHPYDAANTRYDHGRRRCRACVNTKARKVYATRKALTAACHAKCSP